MNDAPTEGSQTDRPPSVRPGQPAGGEPCRSAALPGTMRWDGWGTADKAFDPSDRPYLAAYTAQALGIRPDWPRTPAVPLAAITLPPPRLGAALVRALAARFPAERFSTGRMDRLLHAYGKSTRDLWRLRHGRLDYAPDAVVFPASEDDVAALLAIAGAEGAAVVPFGAGSNIVGCVELLGGDARPAIACDLRLLDRVRAVDPVSGIAHVEAGILGPTLEDALARHGLTAGHFPDSFPYSTLGGWIATRSSGMMSDHYGNIEDMVLGVRMVTPAGLIATRAVPHAANGPDPKWLCVGSEGTLGIITEVALRVRPAPRRRDFRAYLFPTFEAGLEALRACAAADRLPVLSRLNDPAKTQLSAAFRRRQGPLKRLAGRAVKAYLGRVRGFDFGRASLLVAAFQDDPPAGAGRRAVEAVYRRFGAAALGSGPGLAFAEGKYDFPFVRDYLLDRGVICDVAETAASWKDVGTLYRDGGVAIGRAMQRDGRPSWLGCHVSHTYRTGASLYFSYAFRCAVGADGAYDPDAELAYYVAVKRASLEAFAAAGATLSHHHAVGYEHLPWLAAEAMVPGGTLVEAVKPAFDPQAILSPGKFASAFGRAALDRLTAGAPMRRPGAG